MHQSDLNNESFKIEKGLKLWEKSCGLIPGGNMLLSKNKNIYSGELWPCYYSKAKGSRVWDIDGNEYIDFSSNGVGACSLGHSCEAIDNEVINAIRLGVMSTLNTPKEVELAEMLVDLHPWSDMVKFARTGGEANAIAIRIARASSGKDKVAICGYHGWHDWYLAANISKGDNLKDHLIEGLGSKGVPHELKGTIITLRYNKTEDLELIKNRDDIAALKMEVVRSFKPEEGYLESIRELCDKKNIILIFDECTSGFRETYGGIHLNYEINPDMCILGKAIGNGYAITAVLGKRGIMNSACESFISSTFWTEAIGPNAAIATLKEMKRVESWKVLPKIGLEVKQIWRKLSEKYNIPIQIFGINALPTFNFDCKDCMAFKTAFTEIMLRKGFLASTIFYPTIAHSKRDIVDYEIAVDETFNEMYNVVSSGKNISSVCLGALCKPTFKRLN